MTPARAPSEDASGALRTIKPAVREIAPYLLAPRTARVKLDQNESPWPPPAEVVRQVARLVGERPWNRYPSFVPDGLRAAVAGARDWPAEGVLLGNGSNELIQALLAVTVEPGVGVVVPEPSFTLYRLLATVGGGRVVPVRADEALRTDPEEVVRRAVESSARVVVLCSPNNPTGQAMTGEEIVRVHDGTEALVVVDQAYVEFGGADVLPLLAGRPRLVVLRTFSKALGLAGLRAGYLLGDPALVAEVTKGKPPYSMDFVTEAAATLVLRSRGGMKDRIARMRAGRDRLLEGLSEVPGLAPYPSAANFVLFRVDERIGHRRLFRRLLEGHGILVRDVSAYPLLDGCLRVSAGTEEETEAFLDAIRQVASETPSPAREER